MGSTRRSQSDSRLGNQNEGRSPQRTKSIAQEAPTSSRSEVWLIPAVENVEPVAARVHENFSGAKTRQNPLY